MADFKIPLFQNKHFAMNRNQRWSFIALVIIVFSIVFTLYWVSTRVQLIQYRSQAISALKENEADLEAKRANINPLKESYDEFKAGYALDPAQRLDDKVDNSVIVARALPDTYHRTTLQSALSEFMQSRNYEVPLDNLPRTFDATNNIAKLRAEGLPVPVFSSEGGESDGQAAAIFEKVVVVSFELTVDAVPFECASETDPCIENFFRDIDLFITPIRVNSVIVTILNPYAPDSEKILDLDLAVEIYYLPRQDVVTTENKTVGEEKQAVEGAKSENQE